jgi:glycogen(starch) synthase
VLQVTPKFFPSVGGVETHVLELSKHLSELDVSVKVLTTDLKSYSTMQRVQALNDTSVARERAFKILPLPGGLGIVSPGMLRYIKLKCEIVHIHGYGSFPTFLTPLFKLAKKKVVITTHSDEGLHSFRKRAYDIIVPRLSLFYSSKIVALSRHEKKLLTNFGIPEERIEIIPNGVDANLFNIRRRVDATRNKKKVLYVGRLNFRQKGIDILLLAARKLIKRHNVIFEFVGPPEDIEGFNNLVDRSGLRERIIYHGEVSRKRLIEIMTDADLLVLPSRFEPFGIVILEAMAIGLPVIASSVGGIPEVIRDGDNGLLFPREDSDTLASKIELLLTDTTLTERISSRAKEYVKGFTWDKIAMKTLMVYKSLL